MSTLDSIEAIVELMVEIKNVVVSF